MHEIIINLHMHTPYSDGYENHDAIAQAAIRSKLDAIIITDHNVLVTGKDCLFHDGEKSVLVLIGEEIHDQSRQPQKSHLLVFGVDRELATLATDIKLLVETVRKLNGLAFIAHPYDPESKAVGEDDISWDDWDITSMNGIELWNGMSEFKSRLKTKLHAFYYAYFPARIARGPFPLILSKWDGLLSQGQRITAIGGSDAHGLRILYGPFRRVIFPYEWHFRGINTHLLLPAPLQGSLNEDRQMIYEALKQGHAFIGYDLPASTTGFRFSAKGREGVNWMGDEINSQGGVTLQIRLPQASECHLIHNGKDIQQWDKHEICTYITTQPGAYRVEVYKHFQGQRRGWIFSNPIYITK
jgi:hypothetical protein